MRMSSISVTNNHASLSATMPSDVPDGTRAIARGLHLSSNVPTATISNSTSSGNSATMTNAVGDANAFSGGVHVDVGVQFALTNSTVSDNRITVMTLPGSWGKCRRGLGRGGDTRHDQQHPPSSTPASPESSSDSSGQVVIEPSVPAATSKTVRGRGIQEVPRH